MTYQELLKDPRWQRKRLEIMERADFACEKCHDKTTTLNVHHERYVRGRAPWEYENDELHCLCERCHAQEHGLPTEAPRREADRQNDPGLAEWSAYIEDVDHRIIAASDAGRDALLQEKMALITEMRSFYRAKWKALRSPA